MLNFEFLHNPSVIFKDRVDAGQRLGAALKEYQLHNSVLLALPRGGVVVGYEICNMLSLPLDVIIVRKVGAPFDNEFAIGAIAEGNIQILDEQTIQSHKIDQESINHIIRQEQRELKRRETLYRNNRSLISLQNRTAIIVDDGLATGMTAHAAIHATKKHNPKHIIFAAPICAYDTAKRIQSLVDDIVCLGCPMSLQSVGQYYKNFSETTDEEVIHLLNQSRKLDHSKLIH